MKVDSTFTDLVSRIRIATATQYFDLKIAAFQIVIKYFLFLKKPTQVVQNVLFEPLFRFSHTITLVLK